MPVQWILGFAGGVVIAAVGTPLVQSTLTVFDVSMPWGLVVALAVVAAYLLGLRLVRRSRWLAIWGAIGVVVTIVVLSFPGPGGGILIPANLAGTAWTLGPVIIGVVVTAFPRLAGSVDSRRKPRTSESEFS